MLVKYAVLRLFIATLLISTKEIIADIFTKAVEKDIFILMRKHLLNLGGDTAHHVMHGRASRAARSLLELIQMRRARGDTRGSTMVIWMGIGLARWGSMLGPAANARTREPVKT